jgi:hypothetical protein
VCRSAKDQWAISYIDTSAAKIQMRVEECTYGGLSNLDVAGRPAKLGLAILTWNGEEEWCPLIYNNNDKEWFGDWARRHKAKKAKQNGDEGGEHGE